MQCILQVALTEEKLEDVKSALLEQLNLSCAECSSDTIDMQSFSCYEESPTHITYRARLEGTSERDSGTLISAIEEWVSGEPSLIVTGIRMTIDSDCSVPITSPDDPECSPSTPVMNSNSATNTTLIVAGVTGVIAIIIIATAALILIMCILKNRHKCLFSSKKVTSEFPACMYIYVYCIHHTRPSPDI